MALGMVEILNDFDKFHTALPIEESFLVLHFDEKWFVNKIVVNKMVIYYFQLIFLFFRGCRCDSRCLAALLFWNMAREIQTVMVVWTPKPFAVLIFLLL